MLSIDPRSRHPLSTFAPTSQSVSQPSSISASQRSDQLVSMQSSKDIKIEGFELVAKSAIALTIGFIPFLISKIGEPIVKNCAYFARKINDFFEPFGQFGRLVGYASRIVIGIPAVIGGTMLFGGAVCFSKTQELVWGRFLIENPQEEKINTQLARYGAKQAPWNDFKLLLKGFFLPECHAKDASVDAAFQSLSEFKAF